MIEPIWAVTGMIVPALLAAVAMVILVRPWRRACSVRSMHLGWALAVLVGFGVAYFVTLGRPSAPMVSVHYLGLVALIGVLVQFAVNLTKCPTWFVPIGRSMLAVGMIPLLLLPYIQYRWSMGEAIAYLLGLGFTSLAIQMLMAILSHRAGRDLPLTLGLCAGAVGLANLMSAWETGGQLGLSLAAVLFGGATIAMLVSCHIAARGMTIVVMPIYLGLLVIGHFFNELVDWHAMVLAIAPLAAWSGEWPWLKRTKSNWIVAMIRLISVVLVLLVVLFPVVYHFIHAMTDEYRS